VSESTLTASRKKHQSFDVVKSFAQFKEDFYQYLDEENISVTTGFGYHVEVHVVTPSHLNNAITKKMNRRIIKKS